MKCEIVQDLLPLYYDNVVSAESREMVAEHLSGCENCQKYLNLMKEENTAPAQEIDKVQELKNVKRKIRNRTLKITALSVVGALALSFAAWLGIWWYQIPMRYQPDLVTAVTDANGVVDIMFNGDTVNSNFSSVGQTAVDVEIDGAEMEIVYFHLRATIFDRVFSGNAVRRSTGIPFPTFTGNPETGLELLPQNVAAIYYLNTQGLFADGTQAFMDRAREAGAVLVWQKPGIDLADAVPIVTN